jgi:hypothetical protein
LRRPVRAYSLSHGAVKFGDQWDRVKELAKDNVAGLAKLLGLTLAHPVEPFTTHVAAPADFGGDAALAVTGMVVSVSNAETV